MTLRLLTWNVFHGRDFPPEPRLFTRRSKLFRVTERGERYVQVNRPLLREFDDVVARLDWDVALLQEVPPRWQPSAGQSDAARVLTSRNSLGRLRALIARINPDLIASNEGGSNLTLARGRAIEERRVYTLTEEPERRQMLWTRLEGGVVVTNLHASVRSVRGSGEQVIAAAERAVEWAGDLPLVFGGDLNHSPAREPELFEQLERRFGLAPPTPGDAIDHLLMRGLEVVEPARRLPDSVREIEGDDGLLIRLSDHACVVATAGMK